MKILSTFLLTLILTTLQAQQINSTLEGYKLKEADLVLFSFGMDNPLKIGMIDAKGNLSVNLSEVKMPDTQSENTSMFLSEISNAFFFSCGSGRDFGTKGSIPAVKGGNIAIWANNEWAGSLFLASDKELLPWLEDEGYNAAVRASFYDIVYVEQDVKLEMNCGNTYNLESGDVEVKYTYDLNLKKGFNWVEYSIEDIYPSNPDEKAPFPSKVTVRSLQDTDSMQWIARYFY